MASTVDLELQQEIGRLTTRDRKRVLSYVRTLAADKSTLRKPRAPKQKLSDFAGCISAEDARLMEEAVAECRQIEPDAW